MGRMGLMGLMGNASRLYLLPSPFGEGVGGEAYFSLLTFHF